MRRGFARMITKPAIYLEVPARPIGISEIRALIIANLSPWPSLNMFPLAASWVWWAAEYGVYHPWFLWDTAGCRVVWNRSRTTLQREELSVTPSVEWLLPEATANIWCSFDADADGGQAAQRDWSRTIPVSNASDPQVPNTWTLSYWTLNRAEWNPEWTSGPGGTYILPSSL